MELGSSRLEGGLVRGLPFGEIPQANVALQRARGQRVSIGSESQCHDPAFASLELGDGLRRIRSGGKFRRSGSGTMGSLFPLAFFIGFLTRRNLGGWRSRTRPAAQGMKR